MENGCGPRLQKLWRSRACIPLITTFTSNKRLTFSALLTGQFMWFVKRHPCARRRRNHGHIAGVPSHCRTLQMARLMHWHIQNDPPACSPSLDLIGGGRHPLMSMQTPRHSPLFLPLHPLPSRPPRPWPTQQLHAMPWKTASPALQWKDRVRQVQKTWTSPLHHPSPSSPHACPRASLPCHCSGFPCLALLNNCKPCFGGKPFQLRGGTSA